MIYCNLKGGLGNILFQIATTIAFAKKKNTGYCFPNLNTHIEFLDEFVFNATNKRVGNDYKTIFNKLPTCKIVGNPNQIRFPFEFVNVDLPNDVIIDGFFQSEKYFVDFKKEILDVLNFDLINLNDLLKKYPILNSNKKTSIHIRRGDYLKYPDKHPTQSIDYYNTAIKILEKDTDNFIIFSDDIEWCKKNFFGTNYFFVENEKDFVEMFMMTLCENNITCNSSFSWWGAWLNKNQNKKVIGPHKWFGHKLTHKTDDIIPVSWIKI